VITEQHSRAERFGQYDSARECIDKALASGRKSLAQIVLLQEIAGTTDGPDGIRLLSSSSTNFASVHLDIDTAGNYSFCSFDPQKLLLIEDVVSYLWNTSLRDMISIMSDFEDKIKREKNTREW
jgi:hypothetical protein